MGSETRVTRPDWLMIWTPLCLCRKRAEFCESIGAELDPAREQVKSRVDRVLKTSIKRALQRGCAHALRSLQTGMSKPSLETTRRLAERGSALFRPRRSKWSFTCRAPQSVPCLSKKTWHLCARIER